MKVLVVDDSLINLKVATKVLEKVGCIVEEATSGKECLEKVQNNSYDLIFMDIMMPEMDGVETFNELKKIENFATPVVTLTADSEPESRDKYLNLGFAEYLSKPINVENLQEILKNHR